VYATEVWHLVSVLAAGMINVPPFNISIEESWNNSLRGLSKEQSRKVVAIRIYTAWNIWKERNTNISRSGDVAAACAASDQRRAEAAATCRPGAGVCFIVLFILLSVGFFCCPM
jgi:hypothetical protein